MNIVRRNHYEMIVTKSLYHVFFIGVLKYGVGTWEEAKADLELELNSKILPTSDDATPQVNSYYTV